MAVIIPSHITEEKNGSVRIDGLSCSILARILRGQPWLEHGHAEPVRVASTVLARSRDISVSVCRTDPAQSEFTTQSAWAGLRDD